MKKITYEQAFLELQEIVANLQDEIVSIDELTEKSKRAAFLINYCKEKLRTTEEEMKSLFED